jgi:hypothetical protein
MYPRQQKQKKRVVFNFFLIYIEITAMKKFVIVGLTMVFVFIGFTLIAQPANNNRYANIPGSKVAYITKQLNLSTTEAQLFWPVYYSYLDELKEARKNNRHNTNALALDEATLNNRKNYYNQFKQILGTNERDNKVFLCERNFRMVLRNELE